MRTEKMEEETMPKVELQTPAPDFELDDFQGRPVRLSGYRGQHQVILVFNRGFF
jgi:peroxiredoxin